MRYFIISGVVFLLEYVFFLLDFLIPRFLTTLALLERSENPDMDWDMICLEEYSTEEDDPEAVVPVRLFKWLAFVYIYDRGEVVTL